MLSKRLTLPLLAAALAGCAPTVTIADGTSGAGGEGDTASGGNAASAGTGGGSTAGGGTSSGGVSTGGESSGDCYSGGGRGPIYTPCGGSSSGTGGTSVTGSGGMVSGLPASCAQPIEPYLANFTCDVVSSLQYCAKGGCHNRSFAVAGLNLVADDFLIARILNVPATFEYSGHTGPDIVSCLAGGCPTQALLLDQSSPEESWMIRKMEPFIPGVTTTTTTMGCGNSMPTFDTTGTQNYTAESKACLIDFFTRLAVDGEPCAPAVAEPPERPPPCPNGG